MKDSGCVERERRDGPFPRPAPRGARASRLRCGARSPAANRRASRRSLIAAAALAKLGSIRSAAASGASIGLELSSPLVAPRHVLGRDHQVELLDEGKPPDRPLEVADARIGVGCRQDERHGSLMRRPRLRRDRAEGSMSDELLRVVPHREPVPRRARGTWRRPSSRATTGPRPAAATSASGSALDERRKSGAPPVTSTPRSTGWKASIGT